MSHLLEDYREINNVRDKLDLIIELVRSAPRRVFLTERGQVKAVVLSPKDYEDLWNIELDRDMKLCDEDRETYSTEEMFAHMKEMEAKLVDHESKGEGNPFGWPAFVPAQESSQ